MKTEFDFNKYIDSRLLEIDDLSQRNYAKSVLKDVFGELLNYSQSTINEIEKNIRMDISQKTDYTIISGVMTQEEYDKTNSDIFPMCHKDTKKKDIQLEEVKSALLNGEPYHITTVMFDVAYETVRELSRKKVEFTCDIKTSKWTYKGICYITPRKDYEKICVDLYKIFQVNGVRYHTPNMPYIYRFFDVYLKSADYYDIDDIISIDVDFGDYKQYVKYNVFPVWNIEKKIFMSDIKPRPYKNKKQFCHTINYNRLDEKCSYLVAEPKIEIYDMFCQKDLHIISSVEKKKKWKLYAFSSGINVEYGYEFFSNSRRETNAVVRSKADVFRFVKDLDYEQYMVLKKVEILEAGHKIKQTYDMNFCSTDYFPIDKNRKQLCLYFENLKGKNNMVMDVLSYIITALQEECREYECIGLFI